MFQNPVAMNFALKVIPASMVGSVRNTIALRQLLLGAAALLSICGAGCSSLPAAGPSASVIEEQAGVADTSRYEIIDLDPEVLTRLGRWPQQSFSGRFSDYRPAPTPVIGVGDGVSVTIWEAGSGGLFTAPAGGLLSSGSKSVGIPEQIVSPDGQITIPYAGRISVSGRTTKEVQQIIVDRLAGKAIEPQALVTIPRPISTAVTVTGEVTGAGGRIPLSVRGDRVLDVISSAGGVRSPVHETFVRLTRGNRTAVVALQKIVAVPTENVFMRPGDILTLVREPQNYTVFGATGRQAQVSFDAVGITMAEALAKSGGLIDQQADAGGIFVFRFEPSALVRTIRPDSTLARSGAPVPVVYRLNLKQAENFFIAKQFAVNNKDILYVSNAPSVELLKFLTIVSTVTAPAASAFTAAGVYRN